MIMAAPTPSRNTGIGIAAPIYALLTWLVMADAQRDDEGGIEEVGQDALNPRTPHLEEEAAAVAGQINGLALPIRSLPDEASGTCLNRPHRPGALPHPSLPDNDTPPQLKSQLVWLSARMRMRNVFLGSPKAVLVRVRAAPGVFHPYGAWFDRSPGGAVPCFVCRLPGVAC
jgi:hypothetical protein